MPSVTAVVGGQYGSEGKGVIVAHLANRFDVHVRVGGPNAGHSFSHKGRKWAMQAVPCGWINPSATLYIGSGGLIDMKTLRREVLAVYEKDETIVERLKISPKAGILDEEHHQTEGGVHGEIHQRIGSTGEGIGEARMARMARRKFRMAADLAEEQLVPGFPMRRFFVDNPARWLPEQVERGASVLLEGTQGYGLSLIHGPWPYVTSADTTAAQLCADAGLSPLSLTDVVMVVRTLPIRVAGNSGPLENELSWDDVSRMVGQAVQERTTVTKKVRRIGSWDENLVRDAVAVNKPTALACTFLDYIDPPIAGCSDAKKLTEFEKARSFVEYLERTFGVHVKFVGTGGPEWSVIER